MSLPRVLGVGPIADILYDLATLWRAFPEVKRYKNILPIFGSEILVSSFRYSKLASAVSSSVRHPVVELTNGIIECVLLSAEHCENRRVRAKIFQ